MQYSISQSYRRERNGTFLFKISSGNFVSCMYLMFQQDEEASDCPLLTPSPPPTQTDEALQSTPIFNALQGTPLEMIPTPTLENINTEDGLNFMNIVNSSSKPLHDGMYFPPILMLHQTIELPSTCVFNNIICLTLFLCYKVSI